MFGFAKNLVRASKTSKQSATKNRPQLQMEMLETREVPASISGGNLIINGTAANDAVTVDNHNASWLKVSQNGSSQYFLKSAVTTGNVFFYGGNGDDSFSNNMSTLQAIAYGGAGNDTLFGDARTDWLYGQAGNDYIDGWTGNDVVDGGDGNDTVKGNAGNDWVYGGSGNDKLYGGSGFDNLFGQDGDDFLDAGAAGESVNGGTGNNTDPWVVVANPTSPVVTQNLGDRIAAFAQSRLGQTVRHDAANFGNEQCTDLVRAALTSVGAKTNDDFGTSGFNVDYVWGNLAVKRTVSNSVVTSATGQWGDIKAGDILQFRNVTIRTTTGNSWSESSMPHHSAIVKTNHGNGLITVLEQNSNNRHFVTEATYNLANMTQGTVWAYHPVAK